MDKNKQFFISAELIDGIGSLFRLVLDGKKPEGAFSLFIKFEQEVIPQINAMRNQVQPPPVPPTPEVASPKKSKKAK
jgi:hypothetical protein